MVARINTLAFQGMNAVKVDVQVHLSPGKMVFNTVGLPDKAIGESRERVRSALSAIGLGLNALPSILRRQICQKKAVIMIYLLRWD